MAVAMKTVSTSGVPSKDRPVFWASALQQLVGRVDVLQLGGEMQGRIDLCKLAQLQLARVEGCHTALSMPGGDGKNPRLPSIHLLFQQRGTSIFEQDGQAIEIGAGDCLAYDFERPHRINSPSPIWLHSLRIPRELIRGQGFDLRRMKPVMLTRDPMVEISRELINSILGRCEDIQAESQAAMADALVRFLVPSLARDVDSMRAMSPAEMLRMRAMAFIEENLGDPDLDIEHMSRVLGCTRRYLDMVFAELGTTVSRTIWQLRLERAKCSLEQRFSEGRSITDIAFACGFSSSAHFSRLFKERFGFSPSLARPPVTQC